MTEQLEFDLLLKEEQLLTDEVESLTKRLLEYKRNLAEVRAKLKTLRFEPVEVTGGSEVSQ
ncbi:hypothetical protein ACFFGT_26460 [Mucilaginibacter angelicae]|uniref:Uncharacterized protein n=1 Tax=Mucilaginibacter angelicae TaxID=869718 RepID=A0ABV6LE81_9SPHI